MPQHGAPPAARRVSSGARAWIAIGIFCVVVVAVGIFIFVHGTPGANGDTTSTTVPGTSGQITVPAPTSSSSAP
jgi:hypothetical protein